MRTERRRGATIGKPTVLLYHSVGLTASIMTVCYVVTVVAVVTVDVNALGDVDPIGGPGMMLQTAVAVVLAARCALDRRLHARTRRAWAWLTGSFVVLIAAFTAFGTVGEDVPFPTVADALRLSSSIVMIFGLLRLQDAGTVKLQVRNALDIAMVVTGGATLLWYLVLGPVLTTAGQSIVVTAAAVAYPLLDLALIGTVLTVVRRAHPGARRSAITLAISMFAMVIGDVYLSYQRVGETGDDYHAWQFVCWLTSCYLMSLAAGLQRHSRSVGHVELGVFHIVLPYAGVGLVYSLLLAAAVSQPLYPYGGLAIGALVATTLVSVRNMLVLRENHRLAMTDSLTGLANRAQLLDRLERAMNRFHLRGTPVAVLLLDLDEFKPINDTYGHQAGDAVLVGVARALDAAVRKGDVKARLGGDEFAVVLHDAGPEASAEIARRIQSAIASPMPVSGHRITPHASIGIAVSTPECDTAAEILKQADMQMYRAKRTAVADSSGTVGAAT